jgi:hypothetical protein
MSEDKVLMRALRDFNIPKITVEDMPVFLNLIGDLFPALDVERKRYKIMIDSNVRPFHIGIKILRIKFEKLRSIFIYKLKKQVQQHRIILYLK